MFVGRSTSWVILPLLVGFGPHYVLDPVLEMVQVVAPSVHLFKRDQVYSVKEEGRFNLQIEWGVGGQRGAQVNFH